MKTKSNCHRCGRFYTPQFPDDAHCSYDCYSADTEYQKRVAADIARHNAKIESRKPQP